jgi:predicted negative regulator of RcsB-dependent stress response
MEQTLNPAGKYICRICFVTMGLLLPVSGARGQGVNTPVDVRADRERNAPQVMSGNTRVPAGITTRPAGSGQPGLDEATELDVWKETLKRLREVEKNDPARALAEYKKFWQNRVPNGSVGVQAAVKVAQLRYATKDVTGALFTCDYMLKKYADEPLSGLLILQKADVLAKEKRLDEASALLTQSTSRLVALGPERFPQASDLLLRLGQMNAERGDDKGRQQAAELYAGVEQVYLKWLEGGTISHTWQMFEALEAKYQQVDSRLADVVLQKAADVLLKMEPTRKNPEGADASVMAARWLMNQGREVEAQQLLGKIEDYGNSFVSKVGALDRGRFLLEKGNYDEGRKLLLQVLASSDGELRMALLLVLSRSFYRTGDFTSAYHYASEAISQQSANPNQNLTVFVKDATEIVASIEQWNRTPILCDPQQLIIASDPKVHANRPVVRRLKARTLRNVPLVVSVDDPSFKARVVQDNGWEVEQIDTPGYIYEKEVIIEVAAQALKEGAQATLVISSPEFKENKAFITIKVGSS